MSQLKTMQDDHLAICLPCLAGNKGPRFVQIADALQAARKTACMYGSICRRTGTPHRLRVQPLAPASQSHHGFAIEQAFKPVVSAVFLPV